MLEKAEAASPMDAAQAVTRELGEAVGATGVSLLIADLSGRALVRLTHVVLAEPGPRSPDALEERRDVEESAELMPFDGGPVEQVLRTQELRLLPPGETYLGDHRAEQWTVLAPVTERGEVLGLLEMLLPIEPDAGTLAEITRMAHPLAFVVIANRRHTDLFEWGQRSTPFTLPAEIQRRLLPAAFTCEAALHPVRVARAGRNVGGDTFDYSLGRDVLHLTITDAMGHGVGSALTATLCVGSLRNTRRKGASLLDQAAAANTALSDYATSVGEEGYATGLLGRLHLHTGVLTLVNAGHVAPYLARTGQVAPIDLAAGLPLGLFADETYPTTDLPLEVGDRLVSSRTGCWNGTRPDWTSSQRSARPR